MPSPEVFVRQRGETVEIAVVDPDAIPGGESAVTAGIKPLPQGENQPAPKSAVLKALTVSYRAADGDVPKGWTLSLSYADCAALAPGDYALDTRILDSGKVTISDLAILRIMEPASI